MKRKTVLKYTEPLLCYMESAKKTANYCSYFSMGMLGYNVVSGRWLYVLTSTLGIIAFKKIANELKIYMEELEKLNKIGEQK